jgi:hypothetical protein
MSSIFVHAYRPSWDFTEGSLFDFWQWSTTMELAPSTVGLGIHPQKGLKLEKIQRI